MKLTYIASAFCAGAILMGCSHNDKTSNDTTVDTANLVIEEVENTSSPESNLPYDAEFFLNDANQGAPGDSAKWTATPSGLKYTVIRMGNGPKPSGPEAEVTVHYVGRLTDGTLFDASYDRGEPTSFPLGGVIKGWTEGLQLMPVGSVYEFYIPADLAYGENGAGAVVPPNAPLLFKVELLSIK